MLGPAWAGKGTWAKKGEYYSLKFQRQLDFAGRGWRDEDRELYFGQQFYSSLEDHNFASLAQFSHEVSLK